MCSALVVTCSLVYIILLVLITMMENHPVPQVLSYFISWHRRLQPFVHWMFFFSLRRGTPGAALKASLPPNVHPRLPLPPVRSRVTVPSILPPFMSGPPRVALLALFCASLLPCPCSLGSPAHGRTAWAFWSTCSWRNLRGSCSDTHGWPPASTA